MKTLNTLIAKAIVGMILLVCLTAIVTTGIAIDAAMQLVGVNHHLASAVYWIWLVAMTFRLAVEARGWARLMVYVRSRLTDSVRVSMSHK